MRSALFLGSIQINPGNFCTKNNIPLADHELPAISLTNAPGHWDLERQTWCLCWLASMARRSLEWFQPHLPRFPVKSVDFRRCSSRNTRTECLRLKHFTCTCYGKGSIRHFESAMRKKTSWLSWLHNKQLRLAVRYKRQEMLADRLLGNPTYTTERETQNLELLKTRRAALREIVHHSQWPCMPWLSLTYCMSAGQVWRCGTHSLWGQKFLGLKWLGSQPTVVYGWMHQVQERTDETSWIGFCRSLFRRSCFKTSRTLSASTVPWLKRVDNDASCLRLSSCLWIWCSNQSATNVQSELCHFLVLSVFVTIWVFFLF